MNQPVVSIIVPCFQQAEFLSETLDSVMEQTYTNWECIIVNDGSTDSTEEVAKRYVERDSRFKFLYQENKGTSAARNNAIKQSQREYLLPLDADDLIAPTYIEKAMEHFLRFPATKLVYCKADKFGTESGCWQLPPYQYDALAWNNCIFNSALFRYADYEEAGGYNENMVHGNEDWDFWLALLKKDDIVFQIDEVLFHYRVKETSRTTAVMEHYKEESLVQLYKNHREIYEPFMKDYGERIVFNHTEIQDLMDYRARHEDYERIRNSFAYRLGKNLLRPFSMLRRWFGK